MEDAYAIARSLINDMGTKALDEVKSNIIRHTQEQNYNAVRGWYEVEDALKEIMQVESITADSN